RSAFGPSGHQEKHILARWDRNCRAQKPTDALRTKKVANERFQIQLIRSHNVEFSQKPSMARGERATNNLPTPEQAFVHHSSGAFKGSRRCGPILKVGFSDEQRPSGTLRYSSKLIENARPQLRNEGTFVDSFNEFRVHGLLVSPQSWDNRRMLYCPLLMPDTVIKKR